MATKYKLSPSSRLTPEPEIMQAVPKSGIERAYQDFIDYKSARKFTNSTKVHYDATMKNFKAWLAESHPEINAVQEIDHKVLIRYMAHLSKTYPSARTVYGYMSDMRAFMGWLHKQEEITRNPFDKVEMPKQPKTTPDYFADEEWAALLDATKGDDAKDVRNRALICFLVDTGVRLDECAKMKIENVNLTTGQVNVIQGKGQKDRVLWLSQEARKEMKSYLARHPGKNDLEAPLWIGERGPLTYDGVKIVVVKLCGRATFKRNGCTCVVKGSPHKFRRTAAIWALKSGMNVFQVQAMLGHEDLAVLKSYVKFLESDLQDAHRQFSPLAFATREAAKRKTAA